MNRILRLAAVAVGVVAFGTLLTAAAFPLLDAADSGAGLAALASGLLLGNFVLLRQGVRWAGRPRAAANLLPVRREEAPARMAFHIAN